MTMLPRYTHVTTLFMLLLFSLSCMQGKYLKTRIESTFPDNRALYTIMFYDAGFPKQIVIFDIEGDGYTFDLSGAGPDSIVRKNVPAEKAVEEGLPLLGNPRTVMREILGDDGAVIGYEMRPLHSMFRYGASDILTVDYILSESNVRVIVGIRPSVRNIYYRGLYGGG